MTCVLQPMPKLIGHALKSKSSAGSPCLMIVDDEHDIVDVLRMSLKRSGFRVDAFYEPIEALHQFTPEKYDLVLIDVKMPLLWTDLRSISI